MARALLYRWPVGARTILTAYSLTTLELRRCGRAEFACDVFASQFWRGVFQQRLFEAIPLAEAVGAQATFSVTVAEAFAALTEQLAAQQSAVAALAESVELTEALSGGLALSVAVAESVTLTEQLTAQMGAAIALAESLSALSESLASHADFQVALADALELVEQLSAYVPRPLVVKARIFATNPQTTLTMATNIRTAGDTADIFRATLQSDGTAYNLTGAHGIALHWRNVVTGATGSIAIEVDGAPTGGNVKHQWGASDLVAGSYEIQVRVTDINDDVQSFPNGAYERLTVLPSL